MNSMIMILGVLVLFYANVCSCSAHRRPVVIAHRGASGYLPEHTLESKIAAYFMNADYIEQDVVLTKDNVPIVLHDIYLDEVTDVADVFPARVRSDSRFYAIDFTFSEIKQLRATERFAHSNKTSQFFPHRFPVWKSHFKLNSLEEEIELVQGLQDTMDRIYALNNASRKRRAHRAGIYVEIKNPEFHKKEHRENFSEIVLNILAKYNYTSKEDNCIIQCFDPIELRRIREQLGCNMTLVQLLGKRNVIDGFDWASREGLKEIRKYADGIGPDFSLLVDHQPANSLLKPSVFYNEAKQLGLFMHPYTFRADSLPNYASSYTQLLNIFINELQIDGLFTDFTDLTLDFINESNKNDDNNGDNRASTLMNINAISIFASICITFHFVTLKIF